MAGTRDNLNTILRAATGKSKPEDDSPLETEEDPDALTVSQMDGRYSSMRPPNNTLTRMHVVDKTGKVRTFQYHFLDVESTFDGRSFSLIFAGARHWQVTVKGHGPKFWAIYDYCTTHRWPYLREATGSMPGVAGTDETVLTEIIVMDVTPRGDD